MHCLSAAALLSATLSAQVPEAPSPAPLTDRPEGRLSAASIDLSAQVTEAAIGHFDGVWWGSGADYSARFAADGLTFSPNFAMPRGGAVRFEFESARRLGGDAWTADPVEPRGDALASIVDYPRGAVLERYELRGHDLEQSFVFDRLPPGCGDLVVTLHTETTLTCSTEGRADAGFAYDAPGCGSITVGRVVGIDANGRRSDGWIRVAPGQLELGLPQRFVDTAALPLTVDPVIGSTFLVTAGQNRAPDVAYDLTNDIYLVAWVATGSQSFAKARRVGSDGQPIGGVLLLGPCNDYSPVRVANINDRDSFVAVYNDNGVLKARRVLPNGVTSVTPITIANVASNAAFDVGGDITTSDNDVVVVWADTSGHIRAAQIEDSPSRGFHVFGETVICSGNCSGPAIAESGGSAGRYLVVWNQALSNSDRVIRGVVMDRNLAVLDSLVQVTLSGGASDFNPDVDGDGLQWVVSYLRLLSGEYDVMCRSVQFHPANPAGTFIGPEMVIEADPRDREESPAVAWLGGSALVSYVDNNSSQGDVYGKTVDPFDCTICETQFTLEEGPERTYYVSCASTHSGGADDDRALIVWESKGANNAGEIRARRFLASDGIATDLGGGCGSGGTNYATCARTGQSGFRFQVREGRSATSLLFVGPERIDAGCGPCRLVPDPASSAVVLVSTSAAGRAEVAVPIPNSTHVRGIKLYSQWLLLSSAGACTRLPGDFSNALEITIQ